jgi:hypothetical protein
VALQQLIVLGLHRLLGVELLVRGEAGDFVDALGEAGLSGCRAGSEGEKEVGVRNKKWNHHMRRDFDHSSS